MNFNDWDILKELKKKFLDTVEMAYVFGADEDNAILSTSDGRVHGVGKNTGGCLGLGHDFPSGIPQEIKLSNKRLKGLVCGGNDNDKICLIAYLDSGEIFWWGSIPFLPGNHAICNPEKLSIDSKIQVKTVACGEFHFAVLSDDGKVFTCGQNDAGQLGRSNFFRTSTLDRVKGIIENEIVIDVSCGYDFSVVVLDNGKVAAWGSNGDGQLGINQFGGGPFKDPVELVSLSTYHGAVIKKIVCGRYHVLALCETGSLYAWGSNNQGEMGIPDVPQHKKGCPLEVEIDNLRFIDVGAFYRLHISIAQCENGKVYYWGEAPDGFDIMTILMSTMVILSFEFAHGCPRRYILWLQWQPRRYFDFYVSPYDMYQFSAIVEPTEAVNHKSVNDFFMSSKIMVQPMRRLENSQKEFHKREPTQEMTLLETLKNQFNNPDSSDLTIVVDGKEIYAHQSILKMRSKYFDAQITRWLWKNKRVLEIKEKSFAAIEAYLKYLYTDNVEADLNLAADESVENPLPANPWINDNVISSKLIPTIVPVYKGNSPDSEPVFSSKPLIQLHESFFFCISSPVHQLERWYLLNTYIIYRLCGLFDLQQITRLKESRRTIVLPAKLGKQAVRP